MSLSKTQKAAIDSVENRGGLKMLISYIYSDKAQDALLDFLKKKGYEITQIDNGRFACEILVHKKEQLVEPVATKYSPKWDNIAI